MMKEQRIHNRERIVFLINDIGKSRYPNAKEWNRTVILHQTPKSTQNGLKDLNL